MIPYTSMHLEARHGGYGVKYAVTSTIESYVVREGHSVKRKNKKKEPKPVMVASSNGDLLEEKSNSPISSRSDSGDIEQYHRSEARSDKTGFFHHVKLEHQGIKQVTNVNVNVAPAEENDAVSGCFKSLFKCFG